MEELRLSFNAGVEYKNKLVLSSIVINGLWVYDLLEDRLIVYKKFEKENSKYALHRKAFLYKDEAWFIPQNGKYIAIVNLLNYEISYLEIPCKERYKGIEELVYDGGIFDDRYLYLVPSGIDALNIYDLGNRTVCTYYNVNGDKSSLSNGFYWNKSIYLYSWNCLQLKVINIDCGQIKLFDFSDGEEASSYGEAVVDKKDTCVYIGPGENNPAITYIDLLKMKKNKILLNEVVNTEHALDCGNKVIFWGCKDNKIVILNKVTKQVQIKELQSQEKLKNIIYTSIDSYKSKMALSMNERRLYIYVEEDDILKERRLYLNIEDIKRVVEVDTSKSFWDVLELCTGDESKEFIVPLEYFIKVYNFYEEKSVCRKNGRLIFNALK